MVGGEPLEDGPGPDAVEVHVPGVGRRLLPSDVRQAGQASLLPSVAPPVVHQLVPGHADQPRRRDRRRVGATDRVDGAEQGVGGQVLGDRGSPAAGEQVPVDEGQGAV
jgi:hypothetical protein